MLSIQNESMRAHIRASYQRDDVARLMAFLVQNGTFRFRCLENGLFPASASAADTDASGYQNAWVRDNVHIAHAHYVWGDHATASKTARALMRFFHGQRPRMRRLAQRPILAADPMNRPHVRFDARTIQEIAQKWPHAQNDALGYFLWFYCKLAAEGLVGMQADDMGTLADLVRYLRAIAYWQDRDSGHWEEIRKISASSIGTVIAGLRAFQGLRAGPASALSTCGLDDQNVADLIAMGEAALGDILPHECLGPGKARIRRYDAALLFLIHPLGVVSPAMADLIVKDVTTALKGSVGIRRYPGDSYWFADYRDIFASGVRSDDFSEDMQARDRYLKPGEEAQWCIFDPILACIYGRRVLAHPDNEEDRALQTHYLNRSLAQLTPKKEGVEAFGCPEAYFLEHGAFVPNDHVPLQWTQANLRMALHWAQATAAA